jgi:hypothetical protein
VNYNLNIRFMKKLLYCLLIGTAVMMTSSVHAQFRSIPSVVTDSFKVKYPSAQQVSWSDKLSAFQASFKIDADTYTARFSSKGEWLGSLKKIAQSSLPAAVADGLSKSKYADADWKVGTVTERYLPGGTIQYSIFVSKSGLQKKNLLFSSSGQLLKDDATL